MSNEFGDNAIGFVMGVVAAIPFYITQIANSPNAIEILIYPLIAGIIGIIGKEIGKLLIRLIRRWFGQKRKQ